MANDAMLAPGAGEHGEWVAQIERVELGTEWTFRSDFHENCFRCERLHKVYTLLLNMNYNPALTVGESTLEIYGMRSIKLAVFSNESFVAALAEHLLPWDLAYAANFLADES